MSSSAKTVHYYSVIAQDDSLLKPHYREILCTLKKVGPVSRTQAEKKWGIKGSAIEYLYKKKFLIREDHEILREADELEGEFKPEIVILTDEQQRAVDTIVATIGSPGKPFLIHGITGSGKTHVYIDLARKVLEQKRGVIILVPEISLTPQTIQRFRSALGDVIAVIHSHMSNGERRDSLQELVTGNKRVVIGVRSAILAPMDQVGLIIVDEEHDQSYKQSDMEPRYNARDVAVMRGHFQQALVVLGSATPSIESYFNATSGKYHLIQLTSRFGDATLPKVELVDMIKEQARNNWTPFSQTLVDYINKSLASGRQAIILLNRRGFSTVLVCKECGHTNVCPNCSVNLRYHRFDCTVKCHLCGFEAKAPDVCPACRGEQIKYQGTGIQKIEQLLHEKFPAARILRMDQDTTRRKGAHIVILNDFAERRADILLGTQMVAKGLNFPGVALVGVIQADTGLHFPDFRASERTFQLLTQVAGRAGRADNCGVVCIQTCNPEDAAIVSAARHDYSTFYSGEIIHRKELSYPPFGKLARIIVEGRDESMVIAVSDKIAAMIQTSDSASLKVLGPAPAVLEKIDNEFRYSLLIKAQNVSLLSHSLGEVRKNLGKLSASIRVIIDVDPVNML
jgi:primosomal protein N' (replication factor Y)